MDLKKIKSIYNFIKGTDIVEIEVEGPEGKVRLRLDSSERATERSAANESVASVTAGGTLASEPGRGENQKTIYSPMVGTFYRAASPEAAPFVDTGSIVKGGQGLCIIEAMKIMNEIESEYSGRIVSILVDNGQPVEYGEPLFHIDVQG
jgi:acetyl-CoA carboxylase biotin carboxyl carrier protein